MPHCSRVIQAIDDQLEDLSNEKRRLEAARACLTGQTVVQLGDADRPKWTPTTEELQAPFGIVDEPPNEPGQRVPVIHGDPPGDVHTARKDILPNYASGYPIPIAVAEMSDATLTRLSSEIADAAKFLSTDVEPNADEPMRGVVRAAHDQVMADHAGTFEKLAAHEREPETDAPIKDTKHGVRVLGMRVPPAISAEERKPAVEIPPPRIAPRAFDKLTSSTQTVYPIEQVATHLARKSSKPAPNHPWRGAPMPKPPPLPNNRREYPEAPEHRGFYEPVSSMKTIASIVAGIMADGNEHTAADIVARALELKKELHGPSVSTKLNELAKAGKCERTAPGRFRTTGPIVPQVKTKPTPIESDEDE